MTHRVALMSSMLMGQNDSILGMGHLTAYIWLMPCRPSTHIRRRGSTAVLKLSLHLTSDIRER